MSGAANVETINKHTQLIIKNNILVFQVNKNKKNLNQRNELLIFFSAHCASTAAHMSSVQQLAILYFFTRLYSNNERETPIHRRNLANEHSGQRMRNGRHANARAATMHAFVPDSNSEPLPHTLTAPSNQHADQTSLLSRADAAILRSSNWCTDNIRE